MRKKDKVLYNSAPSVLTECIVTTKCMAAKNTN